MIDYLLSAPQLALILSGLLLLSFLIGQLWYWLIFLRLLRFRSRPSGGSPRGVSVVICAHNEYHHLKETLPLFLEQEHPSYEVLVVNHSSEDDTHYLLSELADKYPQLSVITIHEDLNFFTGKKFPLSIGIKSAKYDLVLLTDADCKPASPHWITRMESAFVAGKEVVLGYGPYTRMPGLLNKLIRFDTAHIAVQYLSYALAGVPYMGVGRNLAYLKPLFYRNQGFISHYRIHSGDDDLFINRVANRRNTAIMIDPDGFTFSDPKQTTGAWILQKRRHFLTSRHYKAGHKMLLGIYGMNTMLFYILLVWLLTMQWFIIPVASVFAIRLISQYIVIGGCFRRLKEPDLTPLMPVYEILLLIFHSGLMVANLIHKPKRWR